MFIYLVLEIGFVCLFVDRYGDWLFRFIFVCIFGIIWMLIGFVIILVLVGVLVMIFIFVIVEYFIILYGLKVIMLLVCSLLYL